MSEMVERQRVIYDANRDECLRDSALSRKGAEMSEEILGWKPPVIYDSVNNSTRIATQEDVDRLQLFNDSLCQFRNTVKRAFEELDSATKRYRS